MAKKSRTPPPPRRVQAPSVRPEKQRKPASPGDDARRKRLLLYGAAGSGIVALIVVLVVIFAGGGGGGGGSADERAIAASAVCTAKHYPSEGRGHVTSLTAKIKYKTFPPTSGKHYYQWALWGMYPTPVNELQAVHNLEHGGVVIQYGNKVPRATIARLEAFYRSDPNALLMAPLPALGGKIAVTAWQNLMTCSAFDEKAVTAFRDLHRYKGPERFAPSQLQPGM